MFRIGDFARLARVSPRLLRWYEEVGLLVPAQVDSASGYRYYTAAQLVHLNRIINGLKSKSVVSKVERVFA